MNQPLGQLRKVKIIAVYASGLILIERPNRERIMLALDFAPLLRGAKVGQEWLIRWYQPPGKGWAITEARACGR